LIHLMQGGIHIARPPWSPTSPAQGGALLYARLRYFDPERRRAGVPEDVAALVETLSDDGATVNLVNTNQVAGAHGDRAGRRLWRAPGAERGDRRRRAGGGERLGLHRAAGAGAGARLTLKMKRHVNAPTLSFPWDRV
jgi:hypothetical protein